MAEMTVIFASYGQSISYRCFLFLQEIVGKAMKESYQAMINVPQSEQHETGIPVLLFISTYMFI